MTDYVTALANPANPYHREAVRLAAQVKDEAQTTLVDGVLRWTSNDSVPPSDIVALAASVFEAVDVAACDAARSKDLRALIARARANDRPATAEERSEMRNAFGPGAKVVNVLTGRVTQL